MRSPQGSCLSAQGKKDGQGQEATSVTEEQTGPRGVSHDRWPSTDWMGRGSAVKRAVPQVGTSGGDLLGHRQAGWGEAALRWTLQDQRGHCPPGGHCCQTRLCEGCCPGIFSTPRGAHGEGQGCRQGP